MKMMRPPGPVGEAGWVLEGGGKMKSGSGEEGIFTGSSVGFVSGG